MELMTNDIAKRLQRDTSAWDADHTDVIVKYFMAAGHLNWYIVEGERLGDDWRLFGYVENLSEPMFSELGYVMLSELEGLKAIDPFQLGVERDLGFKNKKLSEVMK